MKAQHALLSSLLITLAVAQHGDPAQFVNPFIGTTNGGHAFPGATLPWGSVKPVADSMSRDNLAGYVSDESRISGISQLHDDGTGGAASLGHFQLLPLTHKECAKNDLTKCALDIQRRGLGHGEPTASPGYFGIPLNNGVNAEVTVTEHTALHRFTYPSDAEELLLLLDVTAVLSGVYRNSGRTTISPNPTTGGTRVTGTGRYIPSFGKDMYQPYLCLDTAHPIKHGQYYETAGSRAYTALNATSELDRALENHGPAGVLMAFTTAEEGKGAQNRTLEVRMGISWTSAARACEYAEAEIPDLAAFEGVKAAARAKWNEVLGTVEIDATGTSADTQTLFWTSLYRTYIAPTNITGDNPLWDSQEPYWDSFYCIWDTFRVVHPLYAVTAPQAQAEIIRALIDIARHTGWLPDCRMSTDKGFTQGGSNADSLLADSFVKGIGVDAFNLGNDGRLNIGNSVERAGIDWEAGYAAMLKDATEMGDFEVEGRGSVNSRAKLGYVPVGDGDHPWSSGPDTRSASRLLEYAYNDFSIALVAQGLNKPAAAAEYFNHSADWFNLWNPAAQHAGFSGFIQPRKKNGEWHFDSRYDAGGVFRPDHCSPVFGHNDCFLGSGGGEFYEASSWEYSWYVPHDMASLVKVMGGKETFSARLDKFFEAGFHDMGDEPGFLPTYLYNYVGQPTKTVDRVDATVAQWYNTSVNGLPGNDDSGSMGAYAVWSHLGFFPVAGQDTYLLNRPYFRNITIRNAASGAVAHILAQNLTAENKYIQSATLNGAPYTRNWISHRLFVEGSTLELQMGSSNESMWGTADGDLPMSLSTGGWGCESCRTPTEKKLPVPGETTTVSKSSSVGVMPSSTAGASSGVKGGVVDQAAGKITGFFSYLIFLLLAD
ncbi:alpha-1,2-mannosidase, putative subfamily [Mycena crocata]|nr:alpha-1,2-mannosidase, putative subfamily [Mycena crocata]